MEIFIIKFSLLILPYIVNSFRIVKLPLNSNNCIECISNQHLSNCNVRKISFLLRAISDKTSVDGKSTDKQLLTKQRKTAAMKKSITGSELSEESSRTPPSTKKRKQNSAIAMSVNSVSPIDVSIGKKRSVKESKKETSLKISDDDRNRIVSDIIAKLMHEAGEGDKQSLESEIISSGEHTLSLDDKNNKLLNGVVRIYCTHSVPNFGEILIHMSL